MRTFEGKVGLVLGVANDRSIAWAMSEALMTQGAELAFTHLPGESSERRVRRLTEACEPKLLMPATSKMIATSTASSPR